MLEVSAPPAATDWRLSLDAPQGRLPLDRAAAAPAPTQAQMQHVAGQITLAVGRAASDRIEIRLDPPELGRVQIQLQATEAGMQAMILTERPETHDFLRRHAEVLAKDLGAAGYENVTLEFATGSQTFQRETEARGRQQTFGAASAPAVAATEPAAMRRRGALGALDIRL